MRDAVFKFTMYIFLQHLSKLENKFSSVGLFCGEFVKLWTDSPSFSPAYLSSFAEQEKEDHIGLTCDNSPDRKIYSVNPTNFCISLNDEYTALAKNATGSYPFRYVV